MKKLYMIGEKNGQKFVAHEARLDALDNAMEITKNEYRRHRAAGVPSWGEHKAEAAKSASRNPSVRRGGPCVRRRPAGRRGRWRRSGFATGRCGSCWHRRPPPDVKLTGLLFGAAPFFCFSG